MMTLEAFFTVFVRTRPILKPKFETRESKLSTTCADFQAEKEVS
jgi:hypothetical protein